MLHHFLDGACLTWAEVCQAQDCLNLLFFLLILMHGGARCLRVVNI
jgi:hypothetical protein